MDLINLVFYYDRRSRYSINGIVAAIDHLPFVNIYLVEKRELVPRVIEHLSAKNDSKCIVAFSIQTYMLADDSYLSFIKSINTLKKKYHCITVAGGPHPTGDPLGTILGLGFDYAFIGESEKSFQEFLYALINGIEPYRVRGVFTVIDNKTRYTGKQQQIDLDDYPPFPYWRYLFNPIEITRGCPFGCKYCQVSYMHGKNMRHRSIENILEYIGYMVSNGLRDIRFISPDSLAYGLENKEREPRLDLVEELLYKIKKKYVDKYGARIFYGTFPSEVRPEHLTYDAARILRKYVTNRNIILGAQSGSNRILKMIGRDHTIEDVYSAVENALKNGFIPDVDYIIGLPGETNEDLQETISSIKKLVSMGARIHLHVFLPLPGTPFAYKPPGKVPKWVRKEIMKIIGWGAGYGQWLKQEKLAEKIDLLRRRGIIMPRLSGGSVQRPASTSR